MSAISPASKNPTVVEYNSGDNTKNWKSSITEIIKKICSTIFEFFSEIFTKAYNWKNNQNVDNQRDDSKGKEDAAIHANGNGTSIKLERKLIPHDVKLTRNDVDSGSEDEAELESLDQKTKKMSLGSNYIEGTSAHSSSQKEKPSLRSNRLAPTPSKEAEAEREKENFEITMAAAEGFKVTKGEKEVFNNCFQPKTLDEFVNAVNSGKERFSISATEFTRGWTTIDNALSRVKLESWHNIQFLEITGDHQHDYAYDSFGNDLKRHLLPGICKRAKNLKVIWADIAHIKLIKLMPDTCTFWAYHPDCHTVYPGWERRFVQEGLTHNKNVRLDKR